jgi:16S rRNA (uracil1498-N3)-methyltransferase
LHRAAVSPSDFDRAVSAGVLPDDTAHRFSRVLRLKKGEAISLFDGAGRILRASFVPPAALTDLVVADAAAADPIRVVWQAATTPDKLDDVAKRGAELGMTCLSIFSAERTQGPFRVGKTDVDKQETRRERLLRVATDAARQSGRTTVPDVVLSTFEELLAHIRTAPCAVIGSLTSSATLTSVLLARGATALSIVVGPEGGLTEREEQACIGAGALAVRWSRFTLRTETAALAALAIAQSATGDA